MNKPVPDYTQSQIQAICALVGEAIEVADCGLTPEAVAIVFGSAAAAAMEDPASADPGFLPLASSIARVHHRMEVPAS